LELVGAVSRKRFGRDRDGAWSGRGNDHGHGGLAARGVRRARRDGRTRSSSVSRTSSRPGCSRRPERSLASPRSRGARTGLKWRASIRKDCSP
jgi:hypothetical protein